MWILNKTIWLYVQFKENDSYTIQTHSIRIQSIENKPLEIELMF